MKAIALIGEFDPNFKPHQATQEALEHSAQRLGLTPTFVWVSTEDIRPESLALYSAIWVAPGSPYKNMGNTLAAIKTARETNVPCLGTCGGFQHMVLEYARNVLGFRDAQHAEYDPYASDLFISALKCSLVGTTMRLRFESGSQVAAIYGSDGAIEDYYCNFGVNPDKADILRSGELAITGSDAEGEMRVIELPGHPFFVGTLFVPQTRSTSETPHPIVTAFLRAAAGM